MKIKDTILEIQEENEFLRTENETLRTRNEFLERCVAALKLNNSKLTVERNYFCDKLNAKEV